MKTDISANDNDITAEAEHYARIYGSVDGERWFFLKTAVQPIDIYEMIPRGVSLIYKKFRLDFFRGNQKQSSFILSKS